MADQTLSPPGSPAKIEVRTKAGSGKRAVLYTRISTGDQHAETQLYDLRELAKQRRYEIVHEYTDTISGAKSKRPGLDQLLADARRHKHRVSRATVCRLVNESGRLKKTGVPQIANQEKVIPLAEGSNSQQAAA